jgi:hypothetical protein
MRFQVPGISPAAGQKTASLNEKRNFIEPPKHFSGCGSGLFRLSSSKANRD